MCLRYPCFDKTKAVYYVFISKIVDAPAMTCVPWPALHLPLGRRMGEIEKRKQHSKWGGSGLRDIKVSSSSIRGCMFCARWDISPTRDINLCLGTKSVRGRTYIFSAFLRLFRIPKAKWMLCARPASLLKRQSSWPYAVSECLALQDSGINTASSQRFTLKNIRLTPCLFSAFFSVQKR